MAVASIGPIHIGKYLSPCVSFSRTMGWFVGISTRTPTTSICLTAAPSSRAPDALPHFWTLLKGTPFVNVHPLSRRSRRGPTASCPFARPRRPLFPDASCAGPPEPAPHRGGPVRGVARRLSGRARRVRARGRAAAGRGALRDPLRRAAAGRGRAVRGAGLGQAVAGEAGLGQGRLDERAVQP